MPTTKAPQASRGQSGTSVVVQPDAAAKILDDILRKPAAARKRGQTPAAVQNRRKAIGAGICVPGKSIVMCLSDNGRVDEFCAALRVLLNPGAVSFALADRVRRVTATERAMGESCEDVIAGRADSHELSVIGHNARILAEEAEALSIDAARQQYAPAMRRSA